MNLLLLSAEPLSRMILEKNIAQSKNFTEQRKIRSTRRKRSHQLIRRFLSQGTNNNPPNPQALTTKQPSSWNADHVTNLVNTGMQTAGQIATAVGNIFGKTQRSISDQSYESFRQKYWSESKYISTSS